MKQDLQRRESSRHGVMDSVETPEPKTEPVSEPTLPTSDGLEGGQVPDDDDDDGMDEADEENDDQDGEAEAENERGPEQSEEPVPEPNPASLTTVQAAEFTESQIKMQQSALAAEYTKLARVFTRALERRVSRVLRRMETTENKPALDARPKEETPSERPHIQRIKRLLWYQTSSIRENSHHEAQNIWRDYFRQKADLRQRLSTAKQRKIARLQHDYRRSQLTRSTDLPVLDWISANLDTAYYLTTQQPLSGLENGEVLADMRCIADSKSRLLAGDAGLSDAESVGSDEEQHGQLSQSIEVAFKDENRKPTSMELLSQLSEQQLRQSVPQTEVKTETGVAHNHLSPPEMHLRAPRTPVVSEVSASEAGMLSILQSAARAPNAQTVRSAHHTHTPSNLPSMAPPLELRQASELQSSHAPPPPPEAPRMHQTVQPQQNVSSGQTSPRYQDQQKTHQLVPHKPLGQQEHRLQHQLSALSYHPSQLPAQQLPAQQQAASQSSQGSGAQPRLQHQPQHQPQHPPQQAPQPPPHPLQPSQLQSPQHSQQTQPPPQQQQPQQTQAPSLQLQGAPAVVQSPTISQLAQVAPPPSEQQRLAVGQPPQYQQYAYQFQPNVQYIPSAMSPLQPPQQPPPPQPYGWPGYNREQLGQYYQQPSAPPAWPQPGQYAWPQYPQ